MSYVIYMVKVHTLRLLQVFCVEHYVHVGFICAFLRLKSLLLSTKIYDSIVKGGEMVIADSWGWC